MGRRSGSLIVCAAAMIVCATTRPAHAQSAVPPAVVARGLYEQALAAMDRGDHEAACPMLEDAVRLEPAALGAKLTLAACYEAVDRLASAWGLYSTIEHEAALAKQEERRVKAHDRFTAIQPRLAHIVVEVPEEVGKLPGLAIRRDGVPVGRSQWGVPLPVDRGTHVIEIEATGRPRAARSFEILADGVTGRAVMTEPPRPERAAPGSPGATHRLPALAPPPEPGVAVVRLVTPEPIELREATAAGSAFVCSAPCSAEIDARGPRRYFLAGPGLFASEPFRLDDRAGDVTIHAAPSTVARRNVGVALLVLGAGALGCGLALPFAVEGKGTTVVASTCLAGGVAATIAGAVMLASSRTTYSITPTALLHGATASGL